jgi:hypothetical protein
MCVSSTAHHLCLQIGSLNMKIKASCDASECLDPSGPKLVGSAVEKRTGPPIGPPILAALPLLALLLAGLVCLAALIRYMPYLRSKQPPAAAAAAGGGRAGRNGKNKAGVTGPGARGGSPLGVNAKGFAAGQTHQGFVKGPAGPLGEGFEAGEEQSPAAAAAAAAAASNGSDAQGLVGSSSSGSPRSGFTGVSGAVLAGPGQVSVSDGSTPRSSVKAEAIPAGPAAAAAVVPMVPLLRVNVPRPSANGSTASGGQIQELSFYDVTADVKVHRGFKEVVRSALNRSSSSSSLSSSEGASVRGDLETGSMKGGKGSSNSLADGLKFKNDRLGEGERHASPLARVVSVRNSAPRATDDDTLPLTEQQQQLSASVPAAGSSSGSNGSNAQRWRRVLQGVSGCVGSGEVMGIMGPSGGGKSTLLMKLCGGLGGHSRGGEWRSGGVVCLDGVVVPPSLLTAVTALVPQDDVMMRSLTVEECIRWVWGLSGGVGIFGGICAREVRALREGGDCMWRLLLYFAMPLQGRKH